MFSSSSESLESINSSSDGDFLVDLSYFDSEYESKSHIKKAVDDYHHMCRRQYIAVENDSRRFYFKCSCRELCEFNLNFNLKNGNWSRSNRRAAHSCNVALQSLIDKSTSTSHICALPKVREWMNIVKRNATTKGLGNVLASIGYTVPYHALKRALKQLKLETFMGDKLQYSLLKSYVVKLNAKGQFAVLEHDPNDRFLRFSAVFWEGIQGFKVYKDRGLQLDATFIKNSTGGTLMMACYKNGNNNIRIIGLAVVPSESEETWTWFLTIMKQKLCVSPTFIISDREKGLLKAVEMFPGVHHAYCLRHVLENFNLRFKDKKLKDNVWGLAKATSQQSFQAAEMKIEAKNKAALEWLIQIGYDKITLLHSPVCKFGMLTSNNVESINSRLKALRLLPIVELLLGVEAMVLVDRHHDWTMAQDWTGEITKYATKTLKKHLLTAEKHGFTLLQTSTHQFLVFCQFPLQSTLQVGLYPVTSCSCGSFEQFQLPCTHIAFVLNEMKIDYHRFVGSTWGKDLFLRAAAPIFPDYPLTVISELESIPLTEPLLTKKRGRPKKKRIESQCATVELDSRPKKVRKCGLCQGTGHNRRSCSRG